VQKLESMAQQQEKKEEEKEEQPLSLLYGPFHRLQSPTQDNHTAQLQVQSQEIWGRARRGSDIPQVQAYTGPLPMGANGIEFTTRVAPDPQQPPGQARWTGPRPGVTIQDDFCRISVVITKNTQLTPIQLQQQANDEVSSKSPTRTTIANTTTATTNIDDGDTSMPEEDHLVAAA
jgi:hypothetical protein